MVVPLTASSLPHDFELPDLLQFDSGERVNNPAQWALRRHEVQRHLLPLAYGEFPPVPRKTHCVVLHSNVLRNFANATLITCRVETDGQHAFLLRAFVPAGLDWVPVVLNGDACWHYATDRVVTEVLRRGIAFAQFNRVEVAADATHNLPHSTLAAWAWAYHRAVDALCQMPFVKPNSIAVVGHSRGGKAALLAGATDERIAITSANNSGAGGAGCFRWTGLGAETLADILGTYGYWFGPHLKNYLGRVNELPFDQHFLKALVAPRALLTTEARGDLWANPEGTQVTHEAAQAVYALLNVPQRIVVQWRDGGHEHSFADWCALLDYCELILNGSPQTPRQSAGD
jgi:hypothetical protein